MIEAIIEELRRLSAMKTSKSRLPALRTAYANAYELYERLELNTEDPEEAAEFDEAESRLEDALSELDSGCDELEYAEDSDDREMAVDQIECGIGEIIDSLEEITPLSKVMSETLSALDRECRAKVDESLSLPDEQSGTFLSEWIQSAPDQETRQSRTEGLQRAAQRKLEAAERRKE